MISFALLIYVLLIKCSLNAVSFSHTVPEKVYAFALLVYAHIINAPLMLHMLFLCNIPLY